MGPLLPLPLLKALAFFFSVVASLVPQVALTLVPGAADAPVDDGGAFEPLALDEPSAAPVAPAPEPEPAPVLEEPAPPAEEEAPTNATPPPALPAARPRPPPAPFTVAFATSEVEVAPGAAAPLVLEIASQYDWHLSLTVTVREVTSGWGGRVSESRVELPPGLAVELPASLAAPQDAVPGAKGVLRVDVASVSPAGVAGAVATAVVPVPEVYRDVSVSTGSGTRYVAPGDTVEYSVTVVNLGNAPDSFRLEMPTAQGDWSAVLSESALTLEPNEARGVTLTVTAPEDARAGDAAWFNVTARSQGDTGVARKGSTLTVVDAEHAGLPITLDVVCVHLPPPLDVRSETDAYERVCVDLRPFRPPDG